MGIPAWGRVKEVIEAALDSTPADRGEVILRMCGDNAALRAEAQSLLAAMEQAGTFIERPAPQSFSTPIDAAIVEECDPAARALGPGDSLGPYTVVEFLGAGGMGEVYRALDARLNREVALKVPSEAFAPDSDRPARFRREAQVLASLNHPNIAAIYGVEETDDVRALVLELVPGPTLDERIADGPIPLDRALAIGNQIAEGLRTAHEQGIVHRDLKPANIKLRSDGTVKILDFGLSKALDSSSSHSRVHGAGNNTDQALSPASEFFGTAPYMSPEQVLGRTVDERTDIWSFGCVLYEMLSGRRTFRGETTHDSLAAVLTREPDWEALPADTPAGILRLLRRCLQKDQGCRPDRIADACSEIEATAAAVLSTSRRRARRVAWALAAVATTTIVVGSWSLLRPTSRTPPAAQTVRRLLIGLPEGHPLARATSMPLGLGQAAIAISPDGTRVAYIMQRDGVTQLYLRSLDELEAAPMPNTQGAFGPFFSPDGRWVGFFADGRLKKVAVTGGDPIDLCAAPNPYGGSWGADGTIVFAADEGRRPTRIRETGGAPQRILIKDDRGSWRRPDLLPGGKAAIVSHVGSVGVLSLETGEYRILVENADDGRYAPSGHLVFARAGVLLAAPFDLQRLVVSGPAAVVLEGVRIEGAPAVTQATFSTDGTLIYVPGTAANNATRPVWVDRKGRVEPVGMPPRAYGSFSLSPDGKRVAIAVGHPTNDVWVQDLERGTSTRLTSGGNNVQPTWTPDGRRVVFTERTGGGATPFWVPPDGSSRPERMFEEGHRGGVHSISPNGELAAFQTRGRDTGLDIWVRSLNDGQPPQPFLRTPFTEVGPRFSPDGRWIAYVSDESGQYEVYVRPYPPATGKWQVSSGGGQHCIWSRDGRELFFRTGNAWMVAAVTLQPEFTVGVPRFLFEGPYVNVGGLSYDVTPDGQRFLLLEPAADTAPVTHLNVVLNWFEQVKQKAGSSSVRP